MYISVKRLPQSRQKTDPLPPEFPGALNRLLAREFNSFTFIVFAVVIGLVSNDNSLCFARLQGDLNGMIGRNARHGPW